MRRSIRVLPLCARTACVLSLAILAAPVTAQAVGDWRSVPSTTSPPSRSGFGLAEMPNGDLMLFGGDAADPSATEWRWNGVDWTPFTAFGVPRRDNPAFGRFGDNGLIVYGGTGSGTFFVDTWRTVNGIQWFQVSQGVSPGILTNTSMAYDPKSDAMVMVGRDVGGMFTTWFYTVSAGWSAGPTFAAADARVVSDSVRGEAVLFAGGFPNVDVSRLSDGAWEPIGQSQLRVQFGEVGFDERRGRAVVMQPFDTLETVEWDGLSFGAITTPTGSFRSPLVTAMSYHSARNEMIYVADSGSGLETFRHAADAAPGGFAFGPVCGLSPGPSLRLAPGSIPRPGTVHRLDGSVSGQGVTLSAIGFSRTSTQGVPLPLPIPIGPSSCTLQVDPAIVTLLGTSATPTQLVSLPNSSTLLGERYSAQLFEVLGQGVGSSNGLELQVGEPLPEQLIVESFVSDFNRDPLASGDIWDMGQATPAQLGGDGRHGSFRPELGQDVGGGVFEFDTDMTVIPASNTLDNQELTVTDGRYYFTDFVVPPGVTIRFVGSSAPQIFVRGKTLIAGEVSVDGVDQPSIVATGGLAVGENISQFNARQSLTGQPGTAGGPGGGAGGNGGDRSLNQGPIIVGGVNLTNGQPGADVQVSAGHAYAANTADTGGPGCEMVPASGIWALQPPLISFVYNGYFSPGGGGGGFDTPGDPSIVPQLIGTTTGISPGPVANGGVGFSVLPIPSTAGYTALEHFSVGGSGGGGGGSHSFGIIGIGSLPREWMAGHGGTGGGGTIAFRSGSDLEVTGTVSSRGGDGALITGSPDGAPTSTLLGISSPGGGGSGGSVLLQSASSAWVTGAVDTRGGRAARVGGISNALLAVDGQGGDGSAGYYRLEAPQTVFTGTGTPGYGVTHRGPLSDVDARSGSRSKWLLTPSADLPIYVRYELLVSIDGLPVLFSDDPDVSPLAADDPNGLVMLRFQGAQIDSLTGTALPGTEGPWRRHLVPGVDSINQDRAQAIRFDLVLDKQNSVIEVLELRAIWR